MKKLNLTLLAAAITLAFSNGALAENLSKAEYKADKAKIASEYKSASAACSSSTDNAKDICMVEAKGKQKVATAELDARNKPGAKANKAVNTAKADADYALAKEKCDDKAGQDKSACVKEAKAAQAHAKAAPQAAPVPSATVNKMDSEKPMPPATSNKTDSEKPMSPATSNKTDSEKSATPTSKKESAGEYVDDAVITSKVKAAVLGESSLKSTEINVETLKGTVQLSGFVRSRADIDKAVAVARSVKGVTSVKNDMVVKGQQ